MLQKIIFTLIKLLLLIGEEGKRYFVLIKVLNTFMCDHTLHRGKKIFVVIVYKHSKSYCLSPFLFYTDFESILVPEDNIKQTPEESYTE